MAGRRFDRSDPIRRPLARAFGQDRPRTRELRALLGSRPRLTQRLTALHHPLPPARLDRPISQGCVTQRHPPALLRTTEHTTPRTRRPSALGLYLHHHLAGDVVDAQHPEPRREEPDQR